MELKWQPPAFVFSRPTSVLIEASTVNECVACSPHEAERSYEFNGADVSEVHGYLDSRDRWKKIKVKKPMQRSFTICSLMKKEGGQVGWCRGEI